MTSGDIAALVFFSIFLTLTLPFLVMAIAVLVSYVFWAWIALWKSCLWIIRDEWRKAKNWAS